MEICEMDTQTNERFTHWSNLGLYLSIKTNNDNDNNDNNNGLELIE